MSNSHSIAERLDVLNARIRHHAGERPVTMVAVTKYATLEQMREAYEAGVRHFGENKIQDALAKMEHFPPTEYPDLQWHFVGNLQTNKARKTLNRFSLLHAIDTQEQAEALSRVNREIGSRQSILFQVNLSGDANRHGILPDQIRTITQRVLALEGIELRGLMTMAPAEASLDGHDDVLRAVFCGLRDMRDSLEGDFGIRLPDLSMGMTHDFPHALECGATIIRIGNYLFKIG